jgi:hypothetical protein
MRQLHNLLWPVLATALLAVACGDDSGVNPEDRLCGGEAGLGLRVEGTAQPAQLCFDDDDVSVLITLFDRYDISAQTSVGGTIYQVRMVFAIRDDTPVTLIPVGDIGDAIADPATAWIYLEEVPDNGDPIESLEVTGGLFQLSFSDQNVLAGTMKNVKLTMHDVSSGDEVGKRTIAEGFFSLSVKSPAATSTGRQQVLEGSPPTM